MLICLVFGLSFAAPHRVEGLPLPAESGLRIAVIRQAAADSEAALTNAVGKPKTTTPAPAPAPTQAPPVPTGLPSTQAPPPETGQAPGTLRLARGGTATLVRKELSQDATLPIPAGVREATWWGAGLGASTGASVFAGHVNWKGQIGPFAELWNARVGDPVSVVDDQGRHWAFRVTQVETVTKHDLPARAEEFFGQDGAHRVVLVTCGGEWVGGSEGYDSNRVVIATPA